MMCWCWLQDFGDYSDSYQSMQTSEGEQIAQLIGGYIDIILKKVTSHHLFVHAFMFSTVFFCDRKRRLTTWASTETKSRSRTRTKSRPPSECLVCA